MRQTPSFPDQHADRRQFLQYTGAAAVALTAGGSAFAENNESGEAPMPKRLKSAVKFGMVRGKASVAEKFQLLKDIGYDGVELSAPGGPDVEEVRAAIEKTGLPVHGVVNSVHWKQTLSHPDVEVRAVGRRALETAIRTSKAYGGDSVLLVPAVVNKQVSYKDAYERSQTEIRRVLPLAEEMGIKILLENVWNNFLLSPVETARYIDEFESRWIGAYFDVGNVVRFGWPEHWIQALGHRIGKLDIKEYSRKLQNSSGPYAGFKTKIGDGDCDWPAVMKALQEIDFKGWATAEVGGGDKARLEEIHQRMVKAFKE